MRYFILFYLFLIVSCTNTIREEKNNPADIKDAEQMTVQFYDLMSKGQHSKLAEFCSDKESADEFKLRLKLKDSALGEITNLKVIGITTTRTEKDAIETVEYLADLEIDYVKGKNKETLGIVIQKADTILSKYHFEPFE